MKNLFVFAAVFLTAISAAFAGEKMELVTVSTGEVVQFQIAIQVERDCNFVSIAFEEFNLSRATIRVGNFTSPHLVSCQL